MVNCSTLIFSVWTWHNDLQRSRAWNLLRDSLELSLLPGPSRDQPDPPDGLHLQPDVLRLHERKGEKHFEVETLHKHFFGPLNNRGYFIWAK